MVPKKRTIVTNTKCYAKRCKYFSIFCWYNYKIIITRAHETNCIIDK